MKTLISTGSLFAMYAIAVFMVCAVLFNNIDLFKYSALAFFSFGAIGAACDD